jgi:hypothetical protein
VIDDRFAKAGKYLTVISLENSHCLDAVIKCEPLVKWLRETIKGDYHGEKMIFFIITPYQENTKYNMHLYIVYFPDTSALSTLVDLAMISAGENDLEVDRISNFHTSCLNFAPLIFDLDKKFGFEDLMTACKPVWDAVNQDKNLSNKLVSFIQFLYSLRTLFLQTLLTHLFTSIIAP